MLPPVGTVGRFLSALVAVGFSSSAFAATVVSNSAESHAGYAIVQNIGIASYQVAGGFTVSSSSNFTLDSIIITEGSTTNVSDLRMYIYSDNSGAPGPRWRRLPEQVLTEGHLLLHPVHLSH